MNITKAPNLGAKIASIELQLKVLVADRSASPRRPKKSDLRSLKGTLRGKAKFTNSDLDIARTRTKNREEL